MCIGVGYRARSWGISSWLFSCAARVVHLCITTARDCVCAMLCTFVDVSIMNMTNFAFLSGLCY